jgi:uncharacterized protein YbbK (DUF523 family)
MITTPPAVMVSACLLGVTCRYDGTARPDRELIKKLQGRHVLPVCPEQLGGLETPRPAAALAGGDGFDVIEGRAAVILTRAAGYRAGTDITHCFIKGAEQCASIARLLGVRECYFKARSPSCGLTPVTGVTAAKLLMEGLKITETG